MMVPGIARAAVCQAGRFTRLLSLVLVSVIGLGIIQAAGDAALEDEPDRDERVVFRHFV